MAVESDRLAVGEVGNLDLKIDYSDLPSFYARFGNFVLWIFVGGDGALCSYKKFAPTLNWPCNIMIKWAAQ